MLAERFFTMQDQQFFAALTGDCNPMHMDVLAARRTTAGAPVVHGIHELLWCLDTISQRLGGLPPVSSLRVNFDTFVAVGETVGLNLLKHDVAGLRAELRVAGTPALALALGFGEEESVSTPLEVTGEFFDGAEPLELTLEQIGGREGGVKLASSGTAVETAFPNAARLLGKSRVSGLGSLTRLVGMACPGLHSIFNSLSLKACLPSGEDSAGIRYRVDRVDQRFRRIVQSVRGCGWIGSVTCSARRPPTAQRSLESLKGLLGGNEFSRSTALIVGGSRGLGELTAKLIATGGGNVIITYSKGRSDAELLAHAINESGGRASILHYDVLQEPESQLTALKTAPTHLYYFATPAIMDRRGASFNEGRFQGYVAFYISGFVKLVDALSLRRPEGLRVLYPSTVAIDNRPRGMTEYSMAKAAGEILCADIETNQPKILILRPRLPRLPTDQTASLQSVETDDPVEIMLSYIRDLHSR
jgi:hypothetical protein